MSKVQNEHANCSIKNNHFWRDRFIEKGVGCRNRWFFITLCYLLPTRKRAYNAEGLWRSAKVSHIWYSCGKVGGMNWLGKGLWMFRLLGNKEGEAKSCANLGNIFKMKGAYNDALTFTFKQLDFAEELGDRVSTFYGFVAMRTAAGRIMGEQGKCRDGRETLHFHFLCVWVKSGSEMHRVKQKDSHWDFWGTSFFSFWSLVLTTTLPQSMSNVDVARSSRRLRRRIRTRMSKRQRTSRTLSSTSRECGLWLLLINIIIAGWI